VGSAASNAVLGALCALDGAAIANAIETFGVRLRNEGFADSSIRTLFPDLPPAAGYAVTARIRCSTPPPVGYQYTDRTDWWQYILSVPAPRFVVVEDVDASPGLGGFVGELHATILSALDCAGYATNGSVRDADAVRARVGLPMFASGVAVSHAFAHVVEFGEPVQIGGLRIGSGDLLFGDAHGVQSVPPQLVERIPEAVARMMAHERKIIALCRSPQFSIDALTRLVRSSR
jgi:4-hydroxy-4-methyl-2-oxoglutarate aldolase